MSEFNEILIKVYDMGKTIKTDEDAERFVREATLEWGLKGCESKVREARKEIGGWLKEKADFKGSKFAVMQRIEQWIESLLKGEVPK